MAAAAVTPSIDAFTQLPAAIADGAEVDVVLQSVDQLDVANSAGILAHRSRYILIALAADARVGQLMEVPLPGPPAQSLLTLLR